MSIYQQFEQLPRHEPTAVAVAIQRATDQGIQPYHALLALRRVSPRDPAWAIALLEQLVEVTSGTQLSTHFQHADGDARRYYLRGVSSRELQYDRARGYCPVERRAHRISTVTERCDLPAGSVLAWSEHAELRCGVATHSALVEFQP